MMNGKDRNHLLVVVEVVIIIVGTSIPLNVMRIVLCI